MPYLDLVMQLACRHHLRFGLWFHFHGEVVEVCISPAQRDKKCAFRRHNAKHVFKMLPRTCGYEGFDCGRFGVGVIAPNALSASVSIGLLYQSPVGQHVSRSIQTVSWMDLEYRHTVSASHDVDEGLGFERHIFLKKSKESKWYFKD